MYYPDLASFKESNGYEIDGLWYPRVTSIVSIKAKPALYKFYAEQGSVAAAEAISAKSAEEGTLVHEVIEAIMQGQDVAIPDSIVPVVLAYKAFAQQHEIVPKQVETRIMSQRYRYAGTIDVLAEVDGQLGVLDIKTSSAIYRDYGMQTSAYVAALREDGLPPLKRWILRLDQASPCSLGCGTKMRQKGGNISIKASKGYNVAQCEHVWGSPAGEVEIKELFDLQKDFRAFMAAKILWEWEHDYWLSRLA